MKSYKNTEEYLKNFDGEVLEKLLEIRKIAKEVISKNLKEKVSEEIKYGIPTFVLKEGKKTKNLFHYGGFKTHVSLFPGAEAIKIFEKDLEKFETSKGTIKFSLGKKLPVALIIEIINYISIYIKLFGHIRFEHLQFPSIIHFKIA